jgi:hypothetical protein
VKTHYSWEQLREEPLEVAQKGTFALYASELLEERQGYDLRVRELLERLVAVRVGIEEGIGVVGEAKKHGYRLFQGGEGGSMLRVSHPRFLSLGFGWLLFYRQSTQQASSASLPLAASPTTSKSEWLSRVCLIAQRKRGWSSAMTIREGSCVAREFSSSIIVHPFLDTWQVDQVRAS